MNMDDLILKGSTACPVSADKKLEISRHEGDSR